MGQDQSSVFALAAVAAAATGGNTDPLLPPARFIGAPQKPSDMPYTKYVAGFKQLASDAAARCKELDGDGVGFDLFFEYSPESFTGK